MPITYTQSWDQSISESSDTREVVITLHVVSDDDVLNAFNIPAATHVITGAPYPAIGASLASDTRYKLYERRVANFEGPRYAKVDTIWRRVPAGGEEPNEDPLSEPIRYRWRPVTQGEPTDSDIDGNPMINSAGDPFGNPAQGYLNSYIIEALRNESGFNQQTAVRFQNKINDGAFQLAGSTINEGEARCTGIYPSSQFALTDEYVPVVYQFEVRARLVLSDDRLVTSFIHRRLDQGRQGWIYDDRKVPIYNRNGEIPNPTPVPQDIALDEGVPIGEPDDEGKTFYSVESNFKPDDGRGWVKNSQIDEDAIVAVDKNPGTGITFLYYRKFKDDDFSVLGLQ